MEHTKKVIVNNDFTSLATSGNVTVMLPTDQYRRKSNTDKIEMLIKQTKPSVADSNDLNIVREDSIVLDRNGLDLFGQLAIQSGEQLWARWAESNTTKYTASELFVVVF